MNAPRKAMGWMFVLTGMALNEVSHRVLHMAIWLLDKDEMNAECPNCGRDE